MLIQRVAREVGGALIAGIILEVSRVQQSDLMPNVCMNQVLQERLTTCRVFRSQATKIRLDVEECM